MLLKEIQVPVVRIIRLVKVKPNRILHYLAGSLTVCMEIRQMQDLVLLLYIIIPQG